MTNQIEKQIEINARVERVWRALTDSKEFGRWFQVELEGPFKKGEISTGRITYPGEEGLRWEAEVVGMRKPHYFAFTWHPYAVDPDFDYSDEEPTLVEFHLEKSGAGTKLKVVESGFDRIPDHRRVEAMRSNEGGWEEQMRNIKAHVGG